MGFVITLFTLSHRKISLGYIAPGTGFYIIEATPVNLTTLNSLSRINGKTMQDNLISLLFLDLFKLQGNDK